MVPKIKVTAAKNGRVFEGYYFEMPRTTYCCEPHPPIETRRFVFFYAMSDWGLDNQISFYEITPEDKIEILEEQKEE